MIKEQFIKTMNELMAIKKAEEKLNKAFKEFEPDFNYISFSRYETLVVKTLEIAMDDAGEWISYFLYETNCGTKGREITEKNGTKWILKTPKQLYDLIKK